MCFLQLCLTVFVLFTTPMVLITIANSLGIENEWARIGIGLLGFACSALIFKLLFFLVEKTKKRLSCEQQNVLKDWLDIIGWALFIFVFIPYALYVKCTSKPKYGADGPYSSAEGARWGF